MKLFRMLIVLAIAFAAACNHAPSPMVPAVEQPQGLTQQEALEYELSLPSTFTRLGLSHVYDSGITTAEIAARKNRYDVIYGTSYPAMWRAADPSALVAGYYIINEDSVAISHRGLPFWQQFKGRPDYIPGSWILYACTPALSS